MVRKKTKKGGFFRGLLLVIFGIFIGMGVSAAVAVYVSNIPLPLSSPQTRTQTPQTREQNERQVLEFHEILRQPKSQPAQPEVTPPPLPLQNNQVPVKRTHYYLTIATFKDSSKADALRAKLLLQGKTAKIKRSKASGNTNLYQVQMGPFLEEDDAESMRAQLALDGYKKISLFEVIVR